MPANKRREDEDEAQCHHGEHKPQTAHGNNERNDETDQRGDYPPVDESVQDPVHARSIAS
jgi:hypothetical protein